VKYLGRYMVMDIKNAEFYAYFKSNEIIQEKVDIKMVQKWFSLGIYGFSLTKLF